MSNVEARANPDLSASEQLDDGVLDRSLRPSQFADFVDGVAKGEPVGPTFRDAQVTQHVCESVLASGKDGQWHDVGE